MSNNQSRRKLLKSIAAGSGAVVAGKSLPESWSKPVIDTVVLPSHASTTDDTDSGAPGNTTTTTTTAPCIIAGTYCWSNSENRHTTIVVSANGTVDITEYRVDTKKTWTGSDTASNGAMGGSFSVQVKRTDKLTNVRNYTGTIVCNSTSISGTWDNPDDEKNTPPKNYEATQANCPVPPNVPD